MFKVVTLIFLLLGILQYSLQDDTDDDNEENCTKVVVCKGERTWSRCSNCYVKSTKKELQEQGHSEADRWKLYAKCLFTGFKIMSEDRQFNEDAMKTYLFMMSPSDKIAEVAFEKCSKKTVKADSPLIRAYKMYSCFRKNKVFSPKKDAPKNKTRED